MSGKQLGLVAAAGSAVLLLAAFVFQALGYAPCAMCIWQRYPHGVAIGVGLLLLIGLPVLPLLVVGAVSAATTAALGIFHTGVERDWWEGPTSCTGSGLDMSNLSGADLLPSAASGPSKLVMCDEVAWEFLALSMASWNTLWSAALAGIWLVALAQQMRQPRSKSPYSAT
ncbi:disulfide bond formation protein B [Thalassobacter stenotrophicus]|uniref:disulfide bond formation protein B n=1 Tax=Thalassobacter stenotrophicus TaxID=266809 RepID=UPI000D5FDC8F|nr:disulfide bond formation protein B [Thalassobacter stenotrophicus]PVZ45906.1 disulfide bond formation protein B [Thalassobacter stenotrophicus]